VKLLKVLKRPPSELINHDVNPNNGLTGLPNSIFPSDHLRVEAVLEVTK